MLYTYTIYLYDIPILNIYSRYPIPRSDRDEISHSERNLAPPHLPRAPPQGFPPPRPRRRLRDMERAVVGRQRNGKTFGYELKIWISIGNY